MEHNADRIVAGIIYNPITGSTQSLKYEVFNVINPNGVMVWTFEPPNITEEAEFEIIQPKLLK